jgi:hypothetical protein
VHLFSQLRPVELHLHDAYATVKCLHQLVVSCSREASHDGLLLLVTQFTTELALRLAPTDAGLGDAFELFSPLLEHTFASTEAPELRAHVLNVQIALISQRFVRARALLDRWRRIALDALDYRAPALRNAELRLLLAAATLAAVATVTAGDGDLAADFAGAVPVALIDTIQRQLQASLVVEADELLCDLLTSVAFKLLTLHVYAAARSGPRDQPAPFLAQAYFLAVGCSLHHGAGAAAGAGLMLALKDVGHLIGLSSSPLTRHGRLDDLVLAALLLRCQSAQHLAELGPDQLLFLARMAPTLQLDRAVLERALRVLAETLPRSDEGSDLSACRQELLAALTLLRPGAEPPAPPPLHLASAGSAAPAEWRFGVVMPAFPGVDSARAALSIPARAAAELNGSDLAW